MSLEDEVDEELFNEKHICFSNIIDIKTYSNIRKLLRVSSYVLRFIQRCRSTRKLNQRRKLHCKVESYIHLDEINKATLVWIKDIQKQTFHQELSAITIGRCLHVPTFVKQLKLYRDKNQVLSCKGNIDYSSLDDSAKYSVLVPRNKDLPIWWW